MSSNDSRILPHRTTLRHKVLALVGALVLISLFGSSISLLRITEVSHLLDSINQVTIPMGRLFPRLQADAEMLRHEFDRGLGSSHWSDPHWRPRPIPRWLTDVLESEIDRVQELVKSQKNWQEWTTGLLADFTLLKTEAAKLEQALEQRDLSAAAQIYSLWITHYEEWHRKLQWAGAEYDRSVRQSFALAEGRVSQLRSGLEMILVVVVGLSLLILWIGERALRPLGELTELAREIARRGLRREDKALVPQLPMSRRDEISQLSREFHNMATALLEREKTVDDQKRRLQEQNRLLLEMSELEHLAAIGRMSAQVAHEVRNPLHSIGLEAEMASEQASKIGNPQIRQSLQSILAAVDRLEKITENYLKLSRLSSGKRSQVELSEVLESVLATYAPVCETQGVLVDWNQDQSGLSAWADRDLLEQVLGNLFRNSLQALEAQKRSALPTWVPAIHWSMGALESGRIWIKIQDNGPGIAPEIREKLFTPFVTTRAQGTGLGLSFVKKVMDDHGGEVRCVNRPPGQGTCFEIVIPSNETALMRSKVGLGEVFLNV